jgi:hypothetical protein
MNLAPFAPEEAYGWFMDLLAFADAFMHWHYRDWTPEEVWAMATVKGCSHYDAIYLVLAHKLDAVFWTADRRLYDFLKRHRQLTNPNRPLEIGDYPPSTLHAIIAARGETRWQSQNGNRNR